jgi:hypothetical protein
MFVATVPAAQDVDILIVVAGKMREADQHLPVAVPVAVSVVPLPIAGVGLSPGQAATSASYPSHVLMGKTIRLH